MLTWAFDIISRSKFSLRWSLLFIVLSAVFGVWRTAHFISWMTPAPEAIAWVVSICIEIAVIAAGGIKGVAEVNEYQQRMAQQHSTQARIRLTNARAAFWSAFMLILVVAVYDSAAEYGFWFAVIALFFQTVQLAFIRHYLLDHVIDGMVRVDRSRRLSTSRSDSKRKCPCCGREFTVNNIKRHVSTCTDTPQQ